MDIIIASGGTGGHIFPAITLAKVLKTRGYSSILFIDKKIDEVIEIESYILPLYRPSGGNKFRFYFFLIYSCILALYQIRKLKPKLVIGFGSYASFPTLFAAKILFIPTILHEQNIILGRVNRFYSRSAKFVATSFPETQYVRNCKYIFTGNMTNIKEQEYQYADSTINVLILAGSQGANFFDDVVSNVICDLPYEIKGKIRVVQQCKKKNIDKVRGLYCSNGVSCEVSEFFNDMEIRLMDAHLIISRAGATLIAEITLARRPAIYIPYLYSKDCHQFYNAKYIENFGAAVVVEQNTNKVKKKLRDLLIDLLQNSQKLLNMANNTKRTRMKNGINKFIELVAQELS